MRSLEKKQEYQRQYRARTGNACTKKYERTPKGKLMRTYRNMLSRVSGVQKKKAHLYSGLDILSKEDFYRWSLGKSSGYAGVFDKWVNSGYERRLSPSIDRIDTTKGYVLGNIQWITHSENSSRGCASRWQN